MLGRPAGGPVEPFLQVGIVSWGRGGCGNPTFPDVFTRVSSVACWVVETVCARKGELCDNPCRAPSDNPSTSASPSKSSGPSMSPSISGKPSISSHPTQQPSVSSKPSLSSAPSSKPSTSSGPSVWSNSSEMVRRSFHYAINFEICVHVR